MTIKHAIEQTARAYNFTGVKTEETQQKEKKPQESQNTVNCICLECNQTEEILLKVVRSFDEMDDGDPTVPPQFSCAKCGGAMYPGYYIGIHGYEYKIADLK